MITLYHVSLDKTSRVYRMFVPSVPETCAKWENHDIERICFQLQ